MNEQEIAGTQAKIAQDAKQCSTDTLPQFYIAIALLEIAQQLRRRNELESKRFTPGTV